MLEIYTVPDTMQVIQLLIQQQKEIKIINALMFKELFALHHPLS